MPTFTMVEGPARAAVTNAGDLNVGRLITPHGLPVPDYLRHRAPDRIIDRQGKERANPEASTGIPRELAKDFVDTAKAELKHLIKIANGTPEQRRRFQRFMQQDAYFPYRAMLETFSSVKDGTGTGRNDAIRLLDEAALDHHFNSREGIMDAYEMRVAKLDEMALNEGVRIGKNLRFDIPAGMEDSDIRTGKGGIGREAQRAITLFFGKPLETYGRDGSVGPIRTYGDVVAAIGGGALGGGLAAMIGGSIVAPGIGTLIGGAIPAGLAAIGYAWRNNERITFRQVQEAVNELNQISEERLEFAREMYNIDARNRRVEVGRLRRRGGDGSTIDRRGFVRRRRVRRSLRSREGQQPTLPEMYQRTAEGLLRAEAVKIERFQGALGIPRELRGATENWLSQADDPQSRQFIPRGMQLEQQAQEQILNQLEYRQGGNTVRFMIETPPRSGRMRPNPDFDMRRILSDPVLVAQWRDRLRIARRRLWGEDFLRRKRMVTEMKTDRRGNLKRALDERLAAHREGGSVTKERTAQVDERLRRLRERNEGLGRATTELNAVTEALNKVRDARTAETTAESNVTRTFPLGGPAVDALATLNRVLRDRTAPPPPPIGGGAPPPWGVEVEIRVGNETHTINSIAGREAAAKSLYESQISAINTAAAGGPPATATTQRAIDAWAASIESRRTAAEGLFTDATSKIDRDKGIIESARQAVLDARQAIETAQQAVSTAANREQIQARTTEMIEARDAIENIHDDINNPRFIGGISTNAIYRYIITAGTFPPTDPRYLPPGYTIDLDTNALQNETFEVVEQRINDAHAVSVAAQLFYDQQVAGGWVPTFPRPDIIGWPATDNDTHALEIDNGMAEARAARQPVIDSPTGGFSQTIDPVIWGIREADILSLTLEGLRDRFRQRGYEINAAGNPIPWGYPLGAVPPDNFLAGLQQESQARFRIRQEERQERVRDVTGNIETATRERERTVRETADNAELNLIKDVQDRLDTVSRPPLGDPLPPGTRGGIGHVIAEMSAEDLQAALDITALGARTSRPFERVVPGAYAWMLDAVSGYRGADVEFRNQAGDTQRGEIGAYNRASQYLTPEVFRDLMVPFFGLETSIPPNQPIPPGPAGTEPLLRFVWNPATGAWDDRGIGALADPAALAAAPTLAARLAIWQNGPFVSGPQGARMQPRTFEAACQLLQEGLRDGRVTSTQVAEFVVNRVIFHYLGQRIPTAGE